MDEMAYLVHLWYYRWNPITWHWLILDRCLKSLALVAGIAGECRPYVLADLADFTGRACTTGSPSSPRLAGDFDRAPRPLPFLLVRGFPASACLPSPPVPF